MERKAKIIAGTAIFIIAGLLFIFTGCGENYGTGGGGGGGAVTATGGGTVEVKMRNTSFVPSELTIDKGTTVKWTNDDSIAHTVTANDKKFDSGTLSKGGTFEFTFDEAGTIDYKCLIHPSVMTGKITVK